MKLKIVTLLLPFIASLNLHTMHKQPKDYKSTKNNSMNVNCTMVQVIGAQLRRDFVSLRLPLLIEKGDKLKKDLALHDSLEAELTPQGSAIFEQRMLRDFYELNSLKNQYFKEWEGINEQISQKEEECFALTDSTQKSWDALLESKETN